MERTGNRGEWIERETREWREQGTGESGKSQRGEREQENG